MITSKEVFDRFDIQLRAKAQGNFTAFAYIVIKDKQKDDFIRMESSPKAYQQFKKIEDAYKFCEKLLEEEK